MDNKIVLDVELKSKIQEAGKLNDTLTKGNAYAGPGGKEAQTKFQGNWQVIEKLLQQASLTEAEFKQLNVAIKNIFQVLNTYASKIESLSPKAKELQGKVEKLTTKRDAAEEKRNTQRNVVADKKVDLINSMSGKEVHTFTKSGALSKAAPLKAETVAQKLAAGEKLGYTDSSGQVQTVTPNSKIGQAASNYNTAQQDLVTFEQALVKVNQQLDTMSAKLQTQLNADAASGVSTTAGASTVAQVMTTETDIRKGMSQAQERHDNAVNAEKEANAINASTTAQQLNSSTMGKAFKSFSLYSIGLRMARRAITEVVSTVKELDKQLTEQAMVTGRTREETYSLLKSYQDLASQTGATTKEVAGVATEYMKQGKSTKEALVLTEAAVSAAKVAGVSTADSVNYLTTALNGFQLEADQAMLVSDKFAAIAAASASDYDELAIALSKVASQANLAGMSIDYTTALLTKGLETTREAPETIGTALKTIIARMREMSDFGETLEGDTDVNNVEKQLAYVGVALRNTEGELRSTEDVLDDLGKKWDTLDKNQQAAVARALAGTRQQSRLIAMMSDYERVTELQEIAQRSAGATAAQAGVYLEGIEAATNNVTISLEKLIMTINDSDAVVAILQFVADALSGIAGFMSTDFGIISVLTVASVLLLSMLNTKLIERRLNRENMKIQQTLYRFKLKEKQVELENLLTEQRKTTQKLEQRKITLNNLKSSRALTAEEQAELQSIDQKIKQSRLMEQSYQNQINQIDMQIAQSEQLAGRFSMLGGAFSGIVSIAVMAVSLFSRLALLSGRVVQNKKRENVETAKSTVLEKKKSLWARMNAAFGMADSASKIPAVGWIIAAGILLTILGIGIGTAIAKQNAYSKSADGSAESVNKLSNEIYKLNEKANAINEVTSSFDKLDNKIIKTNKDMEEMNSLLESAADNLSDDVDDDEDIGYGKGVSEKEHYQSLATQEQKLDFLNQVEKESRSEIRNKQLQQIAKFKNSSELSKLLDENTSSASIKKAQSALYAINNSRLYDYIDNLKEVTNLEEERAGAIENLTAAMLAELSVQDAYNYTLNEDNVGQLVDRFIELDVAIEDVEEGMKKVSAAKILTSDDYGITEKAQAFRKIADELGRTSEEYKLFEEAYKQYSVFANMKDDTLDMIDYLEITAEDINNLNEAWSNLVESGINITQDAYSDLITNQLLPTLADTGGDIQTTIDLVFGNLLSSTEDYESAYNSIIKTFSDLIGKGILDIGQSVAKLKGTVNSFYEKASEWREMTEDEKTAFLSENQDLFEGTRGAELWEALNNNNWLKIQEILSTSEEMNKDLQQELKHIETELSLEQAKLEENQNKAYIKWLQERKKELEDTTNFFRADLEMLIEQEQSQLDIYKDYLKKQQEQLEESLEKRKEAYEEYFDAINQQQEDEDYQEESDKLVANLSKLATSTDMASKKQSKELEQELQELEKERQQTLRERAQEAVVESIDKQIEEISNKFDELLENEQLLLEAMRGQVNNNPNFLSELIASAREDGKTDLQLEEFVNEVAAAFGSIMDVSDINEVMEQIQNNATINIGDQTFDLNSEDGNEMWQTIAAILAKYGWR